MNSEPAALQTFPSSESADVEPGCLPGAVTEPPQPQLRPPPSRQIPLALSPVQPPTLESFVAGDNEAVLQHLKTWPQAAVAGAAPPPLYLWGPEGCGKSHLLRGLAARLVAERAAVGWFDAQTPLPWDFQPQWALLVLDRCELLSPPAQHAAFVLFTEALTHGVPFAAAGAVPPADLPLRDDLRTRLAWGHVFALQPLSEDDTREAMGREARNRGLELPAEVQNYLLSRFPRDLGTLMSLLADLDEHGLSTQRRLTVPLVRDFISQTPRPPAPENR